MLQIAPLKLQTEFFDFIRLLNSRYFIGQLKLCRTFDTHAYKHTFISTSIQTYDKEAISFLPMTSYVGLIANKDMRDHSKTKGMIDDVYQ